MPIEYRPPPKDTRPWFRKKRFLVPIGIFLVFGVIGQLVAENDVANQEPQTQTQTQTQQLENSDDDSQESTRQQATEPAEQDNDSDAVAGTNDPQSQQPSAVEEAEPNESIDEQAQQDGSATAVETEQPSPETVLSYVNLLAVAPEVTEGYDRDLFRHWVDDSGNGCDARREVLIAESLTPVTVGSRCSLSGGRWFSAFDGVTTTDPSSFDVDHMVPLKEAWDSGADKWSAERRRAFANDLDSPHALIAVSAGSNRSKGARDPAEWMPPRAEYRCEYVYSWALVKIKWQLSVDSLELEALKRYAAGCLVSELNL